MKKQKTQAEIDAHEKAKKERADYKKAITKAKNIMKDICIKKSLRVAEIQLEYAKNNSFELPVKLLDRQATINAYQLGINEYKQSLQELI